ncbi:hypothetical protein VNO80_24711 [Phaseolus coccineus]|uniref:Transmembrane protein n=1 Tax=Phaseolus coccineus TaxID=3886 RepID=A0AAN9LTA4_PHACN
MSNNIPSFYIDSPCVLFYNRCSYYVAIFAFAFIIIRPILAIRFLINYLAVDERRLKREPSDGVPNASHVCACERESLFEGESSEVRFACEKREKTLFSESPNGF